MEEKAPVIYDAEIVEESTAAPSTSSESFVDMLGKLPLSRGAKKKLRGFAEGLDMVRSGAQVVSEGAAKIAPYMKGRDQAVNQLAQASLDRKRR